jgi:hypothetical protein
VVKLSAREARGKPVTIRLKHCGTARARMVDAGGKPLANLEARLELVITPGVSHFDAKKDPAPGADITLMEWIDPQGYRRLKTDAKGVITFPTLIPGATYWMIGHRPNRALFKLNKEFKAEAGKALDLGDVGINPKIP